MPYVHLAGGENELRRLVSSGTDAILVSYYYVRKHKSEVLEALMPLKADIRTGKVHCILDSGAFTFFGKGATKADLEGYLFEYVSFVRQYHELFTACVELDVGSIVGQDVVEEWRENIFGALTRDIPDIFVIYVWHKDDGFTAWVDLCKKHPYVGLGSDNSVDLAFYKKKLGVAAKYGTRVHGFAITRKDPIRKNVFYSVDSTSWLMAGKYGATFGFTGNDLERVDDDKTARNRYKAKWIKMGVDWTKIMADVRSETNFASALSWVEYSKWLDRKRRLKVYWRNDVAGKIAASFANTHHHLRLSKAQQMKIHWGEKEWAKVMAASSEGRQAAAIQEAGMVRKTKKRRVEEAARDVEDHVEAEIIADGLDEQENVNERERREAAEAAQQRIAELRRVAPDLLEKSRRVVGVVLDDDEDDDEVEVEEEGSEEGFVWVEVVPDEEVGDGGFDTPDHRSSLTSGRGIDPRSSGRSSDAEVEYEVEADCEDEGGPTGVSEVSGQGLSVLSVDDRSIQAEIVREENGVELALSAEELARVIPMRRDDDTVGVGEGKLAPLDKQKRELARRKLLHGLKNGNAMMCNTCYVADTCPMFQKDSTCGLIDQSTLFGVAPGHRLRPSDLSKHQIMISQQMMLRAQTMLMFEQMGGGYMDKNTQVMLKDAFDFAERAKEIIAQENMSNVITAANEPVVDPATGAVEAEPVQEPQSQGIFARLFGLAPEQTRAHHGEPGDEYEVEGITDAEFQEVTNKKEVEDDEE